MASSPPKIQGNNVQFAPYFRGLQSRLVIVFPPTKHVVNKKNIKAFGAIGANTTTTCWMHNRARRNLFTICQVPSVDAQHVLTSYNPVFRRGDQIPSKC